MAVIACPFVSTRFFFYKKNDKSSLVVCLMRMRMSFVDLLTDLVIVHLLTPRVAVKFSFKDFF